MKVHILFPCWGHVEKDLLKDTFLDELLEQDIYSILPPYAAAKGNSGSLYQEECVQNAFLISWDKNENAFFHRKDIANSNQGTSHW